MVAIHRFDDADGLEQALAAHGITADVTYGGEITDCAEFPAEQVGVCRSPDAEVTEPGPMPTTEPDRAGPSDAVGDLLDLCGLRESPITLQRGADGWILTVPAASPLHDGVVGLELITQGHVDDAAVSVSFSKGDTNCGSTSIVTSL